ncbi:restriction endonuclease subunit S [Rhizobium phaseoli]|uniref:restriction endonuclease subunit S n=1 Tax=Rhizobium phaseoli TaxID=396 RepID=UPI001438356B|nr:restriction endonuclease subunit S [Rhizobium phaseoli]MDK4729203.1 restriction endonuclease subunit S [Rhizobium phaseoli]NKE88899.1 restriction endonuclease [Rhizobium phaseoli]
MNAERLLEHYQRIADAPDAIARLRRFVLDLAVRGKLVSQNPEDEPASELLKQIARNKARLVEAGDLRPREMNDGNELVEPFTIPSGWRWARLDAVGAIVGGGTPSAADAGNFAEPGKGVPWLTPADLGVSTDLYISRGFRDLSKKGLRASSATLMPTGTVLFTSRAPIGYVAIAANPISTSQGFKSIVPYIADCSRFIATAMNAFAPEINAKAPGTTFKEVSGKIVAGIPFPLPPLAEQHRIVAKVDEMMALCDQLEAARTAKEATRDRLTAASLARLNSPNPETFRDDARFALEALPALTARPDQIKQLRQTILNLAVRGKLVPQDPTDEPAAELLGRIVKERETIVVARKIRGATPPSPPSADDEGIHLPSSWRLCSLGQITLITDPNPSHRYPDYSGGTIPILSTREFVGDGDWDPSTAKLTTQAFWEFQKEICDFAQGDIIFARKGRLGLPRFLPPFEKYTFSHTLFSIKPMKGLDPLYLLWLLRRDGVVAWLTNEMNQNTGVPTLGKAKTERLPIPLPPLAEQQRIVARVEQLMTLCDQLEASLKSAEEMRKKLLDALLADALAPVDVVAFPEAAE